MNFPAIFISNGAAILLLLIVLLSSKRPLRHGSLDDRIYYTMVFFTIAQCVIETITFLLDGKLIYGNNMLLLVLSIILCINTIIFAYLWIIYADYKLFADMNRIKRIYPFLSIPAVLTIIACLINLVTPVFFIVDKYNVYHRTDLYVIPYIFTYFYLAYGTVLIYINRNKVGKYLFLPAILFMIPILIGSLLQFFFYGYALIWLGVSIGMTSVFINFQNEAAFVDVLSGLFNRQYLENLLSKYCRKKDSNFIPAGIMLDIDNLKNINDEFGHAVGDDVIATSGKILHKAVGNKGVLCRCGGDEFIILMHISSEKEIIDMINIIKTQIMLFNESGKKPFKINFSIGYGTYENEYESIDDFLKKIDVFMYEEKKRKRNIGEKLISD